MNFKKPLGRLLQLAGLGIIATFIFQNLYHNWTQVSEYTWRFDLFRLVLSVLLLFVVLGSMIPIWRIILRWMSYDLPMRIAWRIWFVSNLGRYLPGKVWQVVGMVYLCEKEGIPKRVTGLSIVLAQALSTLSAAGLFCLYLVFEGYPIEPKWTTLLLIILGGGIVFLHPRVLERTINFPLKLFKREPIHIRFSFAKLLFITGLYTLGWCGYGLALYVFISSLAPVSTNLIGVLIPIHAIAYTGGLLVLLAPGGLVVREGILAFFLSYHIPSALATPSAVWSRLWFMLAEFLCLAVAAVLRKDAVRDPEASRAGR